MSIGERIKSLRGSKTQQQFAGELGISLPALQGYEADKNIPGGSVVKSFIEMGISAEWLLTGVGEAKPTKGYDFAHSFSGSCNETVAEYGDFEFVPQYDVEVEAGAGAFNGREKIVGRLAFRKDWLKENTLDAKKLAIVRVSGDSMSPTLAGGDMVLLDLRTSKARENAIYAIEVGGLIRIKRLQPKIDGSIIVQSDNPTYAPEEVPAAEADRLRVIGRAAWVGKVLK